MIPSKISLVCTDVCVGCLVCSLLFLAFIIYLHIFSFPYLFLPSFFSLLYPLVSSPLSFSSLFSVSPLFPGLLSYLCSYLSLVMLSIRSIRLLHSHSHISTHNLSIFFLFFSFSLSSFFSRLLSPVSSSCVERNF